MAKLKKQKKVKEKKSLLKSKITLLNVARTLIVLFSLFLVYGVVSGNFDTYDLVLFLLPAVILLTILILTWKKYFIAGILFILEGIIMPFIAIWFDYGEIYLVWEVDWILFLFYSLIPVLSGILFLFSKKKLSLRSKK